MPPNCTSCSSFVHFFPGTPSLAVLQSDFHTFDETKDSSFETDHELSAIFGPSEISEPFRVSTPDPACDSPLSQFDDSCLVGTNSSPEAPTNISIDTPSPPDTPRQSPILTVATPSETVNEAGSTATAPKWVGFRIVGDNIDKNIKPRDMRLDHQTQSLHYFNSFALQDRIDLSPYSDSPRRINPVELDPSVFLPSKEDYRILEDTMTVLISRVLVQYMPFFEEYASVTIQHIDHPHTDAMSKKSTVVCVSNYRTVSVLLC